MATILLVKEAIVSLKDRTGSSVVAINKYIEGEKKVRCFGVEKCLFSDCRFFRMRANQSGHFDTSALVARPDISRCRWFADLQLHSICNYSPQILPDHLLESDSTIGAFYNCFYFEARLYSISCRFL